MRNLKVSFLICLSLLATSPASGQSNPDPSDCGMPLSGTINASVTYTLNQDCVLTDTILVSGAISSTDVELTINGGMNTIKLDNTSSATPLFRPQVGANWSTTVNLNN